eukprot:403375429
MGAIFDIIGRKKTLFFCLIGSSINLVLMPLGAPHEAPYLYLIRCALVLFSVGLITHPLINDYVKKDSRGKASSFQTFGTLIGDLINFTVILTLFKNCDIGLQFQIIGFVMFGAAFALLFMIKEPNNSKELDQTFGDVTGSFLYIEQTKKTKGQQYKMIARKVFQACIKNKVIPLCFFANMVIRSNQVLFSTYMTLWTTSFIESR